MQQCWDTQRGNPPFKLDGSKPSTYLNFKIQLHLFEFENMILQKKGMYISYSSKIFLLRFYFLAQIVSFILYDLSLVWGFRALHSEKICKPNGRIFRVSCQSIFVIYMKDTKTDCVTIAPFKVVQQ